MTGGQIIGLVSIICIFGGPMIVGVTHAVTKSRMKIAQHREDVDLKLRLADAGFSVEEIERVVLAGRGSKVDADEDEAGYPKAAKCG